MKGFTIAGDCKLIFHEGYVVAGLSDVFHSMELGGSAGQEGSHIASIAVYEDSAAGALYYRQSVDGADWEGLGSETMAGGVQADSLRLTQLTNPRRLPHVSVSRYRTGLVAVLGVFSLVFGCRKFGGIRDVASGTWANSGSGGVSVATSPGTD
jgi:hypothetical protein